MNTQLKVSEALTAARDSLTEASWRKGSYFSSELGSLCMCAHGAVQAQTNPDVILALASARPTASELTQAVAATRAAAAARHAAHNTGAAGAALAASRGAAAAIRDDEDVEIDAIGAAKDATAAVDGLAARVAGEAAFAAEEALAADAAFAAEEARLAADAANVVCENISIPGTATIADEDARVRVRAGDRDSLDDSHFAALVKTAATARAAAAEEARAFGVALIAANRAVGRGGADAATRLAAVAASRANLAAEAANAAEFAYAGVDSSGADAAASAAEDAASVSEEPYTPAWAKGLEAHSYLGHVGLTTSFNDKETTTLGDVHERFDRAIALAKQNGV